MYLRPQYQICYYLPTLLEFVLASFVLEQKAVVPQLSVQANNKDLAPKDAFIFCCLLVESLSVVKTDPVAQMHNNPCCRLVIPCDRI
jgi:hypothetical protein